MTVSERTARAEQISGAYQSLICSGVKWAACGRAALEHCQQLPLGVLTKSIRQAPP